MNTEYFVHIIGRTDPLPTDYNQYETIRQALTAEHTMRGFFSALLDNGSKFSFPLSSVAMIEQRPKR